MTTPSSTEPDWDEIIVGAGSAGAVLASRLSERTDKRVLLLEAGPDFPDLSRLPDEIRDAGAPVLSGYNWDFTANVRGGGSVRNVPQFPYCMGKIVGGSSSVNGAIALRPLADDFARWAAAGNTEWTWEQVLPYFKKIETDHDYPDALHGTCGPVPVTRPREQQLHALQAAFRHACQLSGLPDIHDMNASGAVGVGSVPANSVGHRRISSAVAYLAPARARANLRIEGGRMVHRVLFEGRRAVGVELVQADGKRVAVFGRRVTLCAGAINTVAILLRSGIGNSAACRSLGIAPLIDLPGVGENLADHAALMLWMTPKAGGDKAAQLSHQVMARVASQAGQGADLNLFMLSNFDTRTVPMLGELLKSPLAHAISVVLTNPASRGRVFLESADAGSNPVIDLNLATAQEDIACLAQGVRLAWKIARSAPIAAHTQSVFLWSESMMHNDSLLQGAIRRFVSATWHPVGTARMGLATDGAAVVDQHCRVHGAQALRVADASVMPFIPAAPTNLACMMLAERVADWMGREA